MSFWDNFAGSFARGVVTGAQAVQNFRKGEMDMELAANRERRAENAEGRAAINFNRASQDYEDARTANKLIYGEGEAVAGKAPLGLPVSAGGASGASESAQPEAAPARRMDLGGPTGQSGDQPDAQPEAQPTTPEADEAAEAERAREAIPLKRGTSTRRSAVDDEVVPQALRDEAARTGSPRLAAAIQAIEARNVERAKLRSDLESADVNRQAVRQNIKRARFLLTEDERKANETKASQFFRSATSDVAEIEDNNLPVTDSKVSTTMDRAVDNLVRMNDLIDDGRSLKVDKESDGYSVSLTDDSTGKVISKDKVKTVADAKRLLFIAGQTVMGPEAGKYQASVVADKLMNQSSEAMRTIQKGEIAQAQGKAEGIMEGQEAIKMAMGFTEADWLDETKTEALSRMMDSAYAKAPEAFTTVREKPYKDADGRTVVYKEQGNQLYEMAARAQPDTRIPFKTADGKTVSVPFEQGVSDFLRDGNRVKQAGGLDKLPEFFYKTLVAQGKSDKLAAAMVQKYVIPAVTMARQAIATPQSTVPQQRTPVMSRGPLPQNRTQGLNVPMR